MKNEDVLVIGGITFLIGFIIALISLVSLNTIANNAFEGYLDMEAYNLWSALGYIGGAMMIAGAIITFLISQLFQ
jgi:uncharacterized membrane protein YgdD (TMEM256/DUF423 family)